MELIRTIRGKILDAKSGKALKDVRIYTNANLSHNLSNAKGKFTLTINDDEDEEVFFSLPGYRTKRISAKQVTQENSEIILYQKEGNKDLDDYQLIQSAIGGNQKAFGVLLNRYRDSVYYVILKMVNNPEDADDLTIEAFGKAFNKLDKYRPDYAFSTWLFRIAINNSIDFIRKKRLQTLSIDAPISSKDDDDSGYTRNIDSGDLDPEERIIKDQRIHMTREVTDQLNVKYRRLIEMRYFDEMSYEEIATELELPLGTVKAQLFRAKQLLFNILKNTSYFY